MKLEATDKESKIDYHPIERQPRANDGSFANICPNFKEIV
jgi:hypothetical protein